MTEKIPEQFRLSNYNYPISEDKIAKYPVKTRPESKLLIVNRETGTCRKTKFVNLSEILREGDVLVLNNTKVIKARLLAEKVETGAKVELLLVNPVTDFKTWKCLAKPGKRLKPGTALIINNILKAGVMEKNKDGSVIVEFVADSKEDFFNIIDEIGIVPIPPYLKRESEPVDDSRYQTVYAREKGAVAAPTAGLHFNHELISKLKNKGVRFAYLTLHTGYGTFKPVEVDDVRNHPIHTEYYKIDEDQFQLIYENKKKGNRIIPVGTTSMRTLEFLFSMEKPRLSGLCDLYIYPGYEFKASNALITNFHLPKSSLIILVSAFAGNQLIKKAYKIALDNDFRFFSYGDSMLIL